MRNQDSCPACGMVNLVTYAVEPGLLHCSFCNTWCEQDRMTRVTYDEAYVAERYDRYATTNAMSDLRRRVLEGVLHLHETLPIGRVCPQRGRLLDVGFGNGSFIRRARECGWDAWGHDVNPTEYDRVRRAVLPVHHILSEAERYRVITFFDSLEHYPSLGWAPLLSRNTDWIMISVPRVPNKFPFTEWKHRRPGEHHLHFRSPETFETLFSSAEIQARVVYYSNPEDQIRGNLPDGQPNIMTCILKTTSAEQTVINFSDKVFVG